MKCNASINGYCFARQPDKPLFRVEFPEEIELGTEEEKRAGMERAIIPDPKEIPISEIPCNGLEDKEGCWSREWKL